jgi:preprotein translocase subunit SecE
MGRIQRKKPPGTKKKKKQGIEEQAGAGLQDDKAGGVKVGSSGEGAVSIAKKKTTAFIQKKQPPAAAPVTVKPKDNIFSKSAQFLREVKVELKKVTWPSRKQTVGSTVVVIVLVMLISLFLGVVDFGISSLIRMVLQ